MLCARVPAALNGSNASHLMEEFNQVEAYRDASWLLDKSSTIDSNGKHRTQNRAKVPWDLHVCRLGCYALSTDIQRTPVFDQPASVARRKHDASTWRGVPAIPGPQRPTKDPAPNTNSVWIGTAVDAVGPGPSSSWCAGVVVYKAD